MTRLFFTIDTEYSAGITARRGGGSRADNFARSIACETPTGPVGIFYQMDVLDACGLKAVFFVDPMPALLWGKGAIEDVVRPIVKRGHEVQLHLHTEWLELSGADNPLGEGRSGRDIKNFSFEEQCVLLDWGRNLIADAGAPPPIAFRAGNYGANDDTLRALAEIGMVFDSNHCPGIEASNCDISLGPDVLAPQPHLGVVEFPIGCIATKAGGRRHYQLTALSQRELTQAARFAVRQGHGALTLVSHSFELMSRDRRRANPILMRRFEKFCSNLAHMKGLESGLYAHVDAERVRPVAEPPELLPEDVLRESGRIVEQVVSNLLYGSK